MTTTNELNEENTVSCEVADVFFNALLNEEETLENDVRSLYLIEAEANKAEYKSESYFETQKELYEGKVLFMSKHGSEKLSIFNSYKTLKSKIDFVVLEKGTLKRYKNNKMNKETREF